MEKRSLITIFARCFRGIAKLSVATDDNFFADLLNHEFDELFLCYVNFLKQGGTIGNSNHVAQYCAGKNLSFQIKNLLNLI